MQPIRVVVVCPYGLKDFGGVANQSVLLTAGLREAGVDAYLAIHVMRRNLLQPSQIGCGISDEHTLSKATEPPLTSSLWASGS